MATHNAPCEREALQDGLRRESVHINEASPTADESLPPLLKIISTGDYSFMDYDSPIAHAHATINISGLDCGNTLKGLDGKEHGRELIKDRGSFSHGASACSQPESSIEDAPKLAPVSLHTSNQSTPKSGGVLTPKSILSKRGGLSPTPRGASLTPRGVQAELARKVSFLSRMQKGDNNNTNLANAEVATTDDPPHKNSMTIGIYAMDYITLCLILLLGNGL